MSLWMLQFPAVALSRRTGPTGFGPRSRLWGLDSDNDAGPGPGEGPGEGYVLARVRVVGWVWGGGACGCGLRLLGPPPRARGRERAARVTPRDQGDSSPSTLKFGPGRGTDGGRHKPPQRGHPASDRGDSDTMARSGGGDAAPFVPPAGEYGTKALRYGGASRYGRSLQRFRRRARATPRRRRPGAGVCPNLVRRLRFDSGPWWQ